MVSLSFILLVWNYIENLVSYNIPRFLVKNNKVILKTLMYTSIVTTKYLHLSEIHH